MTKGSKQEEDITFVNIFAPPTKVSKYYKQILTNLRGEINNSSIILGNFNTT